MKWQSKQDKSKRTTPDDREPSYLVHSASGRGRVVWYDKAGVRRQKLLPGAFKSPESKLAFKRFKNDLDGSPLGDPSRDDTAALSVNELWLAFLEHAQEHYRRPDGTNTHEVVEFKRLSKLTREVYGELPANKFTPKRLKAIRKLFIRLGWCRTVINRRIQRIVRVWKWGVAEMGVKVRVYLALKTLAGLQRGRLNVRESDPVEPVPEAVVDATLSS